MTCRWGTQCALSETPSQHMARTIADSRIRAVPQHGWTASRADLGLSLNMSSRCYGCAVMNSPTFPTTTRVEGVSVFQSRTPAWKYCGTRGRRAGKQTGAQARCDIGFADPCQHWVQFCVATYLGVSERICWR
eukprot:9485449-Pyramimonas_sp.AAC.3